LHKNCKKKRRIAFEQTRKNQHLNYNPMRINYKNKITAFIAALIFVGLSTVSFAQRADGFRGYMYLQPNIGLTNYFGDLNNWDYHNKKMKFGYGGLLGYQFSPVFGVRGQVVASKLESDSWKNNRTLEAKTWDATGQLTLNVNELVGKYNPDRLLNFYLFGGAGYIHENTTVKNRVQLVSLRTAKNDGLVFPWGGGLSARLSDAVNVNLEYGMHTTARDSELDLTSASVPANKSKYDMFSYGSAGLTIKLAGKDTDKDGIPDKIDRCPTVPGKKELQGCPDKDNDGIADIDDLCPDVAGKAEFKGCPDTDNDGIPDKDDRCPTVAGTKELKGCPDKDGDGIADIDDRCPDVKGTVELKGCPDKDGDGIADIDDRCPDQKGPAALKGCPDRDGDGVADIDDKCPDVAGPASNYGCPVVVEKAPSVQIYKVVYFNFDKSVVITKYTKDLDEVASLMKANSDVKVSVEGYADAVGSENYNMRLSEKRADYVIGYLVKKGVDKTRLIKSFFGESKPAADNNSSEGRAKNRRVEIKNAK
jgi:OmpA-OmpF porin, OOP family